MDRDKRWERTKKAYDAIDRRTGVAHTRARLWTTSRTSYENGVTDEFIEPATIVDADDKPVGPLRRRRLRDLLQLPVGSRPTAHAGAGIRRLRRLRAQAASDDRHDHHDAVRPHVHLSGGLPAAVVHRHVRRADRRHRPDQPPRGGNREVRARHVLLQLRHRKARTRARTASSSRRRRSPPTIWRPK